MELLLVASELSTTGQAKKLYYVTNKAAADASSFCFAVNSNWIQYAPKSRGVFPEGDPDEGGAEAQGAKDTE